MRIARFFAPFFAFASVALIAACGDSGTSSSTGDGETCTTASDCNGTPCATPVCNDNQCGTVPVAMGTVLGTQALGDCARIVCDGQGSSTEIEDTTDVPSGAGDCQVGACDGTTATQTPKEPGVTCASNGGKVCDGAGACVECVMGTDCSSGTCKSDHTCAPASCTNEMQDGDETDVDCGGADCDSCADSLGCIAPTDCQSGVCTATICQAPTCLDTVMNGTETDVDCGSTCPTKCALGDGCMLPADCATNICTSNVCAQINGCDPTNTQDLTGQATVEITTSGNTWTPKCIKVSVGTELTVNATFTTHPLLGGEVVGGAKVPASTGPFVPITSSGTTKVVTMSAAGTFPYYCDVHALGGMTGVVFVE